MFIQNEIQSLEDVLLLQDSDMRELLLPIGVRNRVISIQSEYQRNGKFLENDDYSSPRMSSPLR